VSLRQREWDHPDGETKYTERKRSPLEMRLKISSIHFWGVPLFWLKYGSGVAVLARAGKYVNTYFQILWNFS
jgi:hypothetical protein